MSTTVANIKASASGGGHEDPARALFAVLDGKKAEIRSLLPKSIDVDHFIGVCKTAVLQNPDLAQADRRTFFTACMAAANDAMFPDGKEAVLNVYNSKVKIDGRDQWIKKVQYLPMVGGMVKKLYATGLVSYVDAAAVYEADLFEYERGDISRLMHRPTMADDPGKIVAAYVVVKLSNGEIKREVMPRRDIEKVRAASKAPDGPGWTTWYDQFAIKSAIKRCYKQLPKIKELESAIAHDNEATGLASAGVTLDAVGVEMPRHEEDPEPLRLSAPAQSALDAINAAADLAGIARALSGLKAADKAAVKPYAEARQAEIKAARQPDPQDEALRQVETAGRVDAETGEIAPPASDPWMAEFEQEELARGA